MITGIDGFIGTHLAKNLDLLGASVYGISKSVMAKRIFKLNIINYTPLEALFNRVKIDICFHLAGGALVEYGQNEPFETFKVNTYGTLNILEIARKNRLKKIIIASTSHVYGDHKPPFFEEYPPKPSRPYETSKVCADLIAQSYADTFNLPVLIPRFVNIYGPGDKNYGRLIPKTIRSLMTNQMPSMWGGKVKRSYLYVDDAVTAYLKLAAFEKFDQNSSRIFNFGNNEIISVEELIRKIIKLSGRNVKVNKIDIERDLEIGSQFVSWKKAKKLLNWAPKTPLDNGLKKTIDWYTRSRIYEI